MKRIRMVARAKRTKLTGRGSLSKKSVKRLPVGRKLVLLLGIIAFLACLFVFSWLLRFQSVEPLERDVLIPVLDLKTRKMGYMDIDGNLVIDCQYTYTSEFNEDGLAIVSKDKDGRDVEGIIDQKGNLLFPFTYSELSLKEGSDIVIVIDHVDDPNSETGIVSRYGYCTLEGKVILPLEYQFASMFVGGKAFVKKENEWMLIDKSGKKLKAFSDIALILTECLYDDAVPFTTEGSDFASSYGSDRWGYIDVSGTVFLNEQYGKATNFENGLAIVETMKKDGTLEASIIDKSGRQKKSLGEAEFSDGFSGGIAVGLRLDSGFGAINTKGEWLIKPSYDAVRYCDGVITVEDEPSHFLFYNKKGMKLLEWSYPCTEFYRGYIFYLKKGRIYMMDIHGKTIAEVPKGYAPFRAGWTNLQLQ